VTNRFASVPILSPDGKTVGFVSVDDQGRPGFAICNLPDCALLRFLPPNSSGPRISWTPDGTGFLYVNVAETPQNLWIEPLDGSPPRQLTHFTDDRQITDADWSRDGKRLAIARTTTTRDIVLFKGLKP
jgi:Tol biopolymer transport system component